MHNHIHEYGHITFWNINHDGVMSHLFNIDFQIESIILRFFSVSVV